jgi:hypothetical protein
LVADSEAPRPFLEKIATLERQREGNIAELAALEAAQRSAARS